MNFYSTSERVISECGRQLDKKRFETTILFKKICTSKQERKEMAVIFSINSLSVCMNPAALNGGCLHQIDFHSFIELLINSMHIKIASRFIENVREISFFATLYQLIEHLRKYGFEERFFFQKNR